MAVWYGAPGFNAENTSKVADGFFGALDRIYQRPPSFSSPLKHDFVRLARLLEKGRRFKVDFDFKDEPIAAFLHRALTYKQLSVFLKASTNWFVQKTDPTAFLSMLPSQILQEIMLVFGQASTTRQKALENLMAKLLPVAR